MHALNYHHLYYFWVVCCEGGFTKGSVKLRLSQSAVSEQVRRLEDVIGQKLIDRTTRKFELTEAGSVAMKYADTIFATGREMMDFLHHRPTSARHLVRIGALGSLSRNFQAQFLSPLLTRDDVHFAVTVGDSKRLLRMLRDHSLDVVLSTFPASEEETGELHTQLLKSSPLCLVAAKKTRPRPGTELTELLAREKVFIPSAALESRSALDLFARNAGIRMNVAGESDDVALLRVLALRGRGLVVIPRMGVAGDIEDRRIAVLHEFKGIRQRFYAITRQKKFPNPVIADLIRKSR